MASEEALCCIGGPIHTSTLLPNSFSSCFVRCFSLFRERHSQPVSVSNEMGTSVNVCTGFCTLEFPAVRQAHGVHAVRSWSAGAG
jgi:hypothetical protein